ncbi:MAG: ribose-phosphate diphosphokinase [Oscillospiraceae bacterium]|nr:ribose-phosphate diphosphokinase [Oscillospiraceae bacterium]
MRNDSQIKVFSGSASREFTKKICDFLSVPVGKSEVITFSEGNIYVKIGEKVRGMDVYIVQTIGLNPNNEFVELLFWLDAFKRSGVNSVTAIIPYFSYAKADKKDEPRVSIRARVCADCLETAGVDRIVTMDLHSSQIQGFFRKPVDHLYAANIFCDYMLNLIENSEKQSFSNFQQVQQKSMSLDNYVIASPDEGFAKNARYYSNKLGVPLVIGNKQRLFHNEKAEIIGIIGDVDNKTAIVVDDFTISCGTLIEIAKTLKAKGAKEVYAFVSHELLSKKAVDALNESVIKKLITTDTVNNPNIVNTDKIEIISVSELFAKAIKIIHEKDSLSELFL